VSEEWKGYFTAEDAEDTEERKGFELYLFLLCVLRGLCDEQSTFFSLNLM
jgi:hypothetical protein